MFDLSIRRKISKIAFGFSFAFLTLLIAPKLSTASPRPELYPNAKLKEAGPSQSRKDIADCQIQAEDYESKNSSNKQGERVGNTAKGAAKGAALGALGGTIVNGKAGRGAGAGAAIGGVKAVAQNRKEAREGSPVYRKFVEGCLEDKGYKVLEWKE